MPFVDDDADYRMVQLKVFNAIAVVKQVIEADAGCEVICRNQRREIGPGKFPNRYSAGRDAERPDAVAEVRSLNGDILPGKKLLNLLKSQMFCSWCVKKGRRQDQKQNDDACNHYAHLQNPSNSQSDAPGGSLACSLHAGEI